MKPSEAMIANGARAMQKSKAWPAVFAAGSAELLARACLTAALRDIEDSDPDNHRSERK